MRRKIYKSLTAILLASTMITGVVQTPITSYAKNEEEYTATSYNTMKELLNQAQELVKNESA